jgi:CheY-like chemotaxis protein
MGDAPSLPQVLVVEDNQDLREALCELLSLEGYRPKGCTSGEAAWMQLANGLRPSAMIVDLALRRMSGRELLRLLRGTEWGRQIPVLLLSGWERLEQFLDYADAVLRKDAETVSIIRTVNRLATRGRSAGALDTARFERRPPQRVEASGSGALRDAPLCNRHTG